MKNLIELLTLLVLVSAATSAMSLTLTRAKIFEWLREWLKKHNKFVAELVSCPYCMSHWVGLAMVLAFPVRWPEWPLWMDLVLFTFVVVAASSVINGWVYSAISSIGDEYAEMEIEGDD